MCRSCIPTMAQAGHAAREQISHDQFWSLDVRCTPISVGSHTWIDQLHEKSCHDGLGSLKLSIRLRAFSTRISSWVMHATVLITSHKLYLTITMMYFTDNSAASVHMFFSKLFQNCFTVRRYTIIFVCILHSIVKFRMKLLMKVRRLCSTLQLGNRFLQIHVRFPGAVLARKFWRGALAPISHSSPSPFSPFSETEKIRTSCRPTFEICH